MQHRQKLKQDIAIVQETLACGASVFQKRSLDPLEIESEVFLQEVIDSDQRGLLGEAVGNCVTIFVMPAHFHLLQMLSDEYVRDQTLVMRGIFVDAGHHFSGYVHIHLRLLPTHQLTENFTEVVDSFVPFVGWVPAICLCPHF
jgi:hypothetical protein